MKQALSKLLLFALALPCLGQENSESKPVELKALQASIGVWDAVIKVWPHGPDADPIKFKGVETNRAFGEHWLASDLVYEFHGHPTAIHSIIGYDLDKGKLVGKVIDPGPYAASMTGDYDSASKTVRWTTRVKSPSGKPLVQKTTVTHDSANQRTLVLSMPIEEQGDFVKFMQIVFTKRK